jgi:hypothetical protein
MVALLVVEEAALVRRSTITPRDEMRLGKFLTRYNFENILALVAARNIANISRRVFGETA